MGTYPPRECGIATFTQDLLKSSQKYLGSGVACKVAAMNLTSTDSYNYPSEVIWEIDQDNVEDYIKFASRLNSNKNVNGVILQHEYGIYGGLDGQNILTFMERLKKPILVTLHTVLPYPSENMRSVTQRIIDIANIVVVLTESSKNVLERVYPSVKGKVNVIPHGIHYTRFTSSKKAKISLKLNPKLIVLSTFGLLSRGKGIEYVIKALPKLVIKHPSLIYLILGQTHPVVRREEGESYRKELTELVSELNLKNNVKFYDQYLNLNDLFKYLKATDIYISTSINPDQAVSGTLSYALGTGRAVVSTEFAQAKEIVTKESGILVPIKDSDAYTRALTELLDRNDLKEKNRNAYSQTRNMLWKNVSRQYSSLLKRYILPPLNLTHFNNMTGKYGLFQFANLDKPNKKFGYTLDDNARALVVCSWLYSENTAYFNRMIEIYLNLIKKCQLPEGRFINYLDFKNHTTQQNLKEDLQDASARAYWALSEVMSNSKISKTYRDMAKNIFLKGFPYTEKPTHIRSSAFIIKSFAKVSKINREYSELLKNKIKDHADFIMVQYKNNSVKNWNWFESYLGYNNAVIPESLLIAGDITNSNSYTEKGYSSLNFLVNKTFSSNKYIPIGHSDWYRNNEKRSNFDQQPEDPASMILALSTAYEITHDTHYRKYIDTCFSWFLGNNSLEKPLYNYENGGCYDGLHPDRVNQNQGGESLVSYLLSRLAISKLNSLDN
jgi:glycosyltransferase involved in cell wall biosynthesis